MCKKLSIIWLTCCFLCSFAADTDIDPVLKGKCFEDIRKEAAKYKIYSDEDYALGKKLITRMKEMALNRKPALAKPYPVMEGIIYRFGRLYYTENSWYDRQLFANRMLWNKSSSPFKKKSVEKTMQIMKGYGTGLSSFFGRAYYKLLYETAKNDPDFKLLPTIFLDRRPELPADFFKRFTTSPNTLRVDNKAVMLSYACDRGVSPKQFGEYVADLKKTHGRDDFTIVTEFTENCHRKNCGWNYGTPNWPSVHFRKTGKISARHMLFFFDTLTDYLTHGGGIDLAVYAGEHDFTMSYRTFDELLLPLCGAACAQPGFNGKKLLSLQIMNGYAAVNGAQTLSADGTLTARKYMDLCRKYKVDIPMGFEWDELNELTNWEPTVARPMAMQRIFKYYMGDKPSPLPGDDTSIPNFIISHRRQLPLGNIMVMEVLNIPDGVNTGKYSCKLELLDHNKKIVWSSGEWEFDAEQIKDMRFELPSEKFTSASLLAPRLTVTHNGKTTVYGDGLPCITLRAGVCTDTSWFSTPLRNVLKLKGNISLVEKQKLSPNAAEFTLNVDIDSPEKITSAEAVQNSMAIFSYDLADEYLQNDPARNLYRINYRYINTPYKQVVNISSQVKNAPSLIGFSHHHPPTEKAEKFPGKIPDYKLINGVMIAYQLFSLNKKDVENAVLSFGGNRVAGPTDGAEIKLDIPLKNLGETGVFSHVFEDGLAITVEKLYLSPHLPLPLNTQKLKFSAPVVCDTQNSVITARLISENGKVYWSYGVVPEKDNSKLPQKKISTYCDKRGVVKFPVNSGYLPEINYDFSPRYGHLLYCSAGREYFAQAGSFTSTAISCEAELGSWHTIPFILMSRVKNKLNTPAPAWVREKDNSWALDFDGKSGNFLAFPGSVISQRCGFSMTMEILPRELTREQIIFRQYGPAYQTGFCIMHRNGELVISFRYRTPHQEESGSKNFKTGLKLTENRYQQLRFEYDGKTITVAVDKKISKIPCSGIPYWSTPSNFGGDISKNSKGNPSFFNGRLKSFKVKRI